VETYCAQVSNLQFLWRHIVLRSVSFSFCGDILYSGQYLSVYVETYCAQVSNLQFLWRHIVLRSVSFSFCGDILCSGQYLSVSMETYCAQVSIFQFLGRHIVLRSVSFSFCGDIIGLKSVSFSSCGDILCSGQYLSVSVETYCAQVSIFQFLWRHIVLRSVSFSFCGDILCSGQCLSVSKAVLPNLFSTTAHLLEATHQTAHLHLWHLVYIEDLHMMYIHCEALKGSRWKNRYNSYNN